MRVIFQSPVSKVWYCVFTECIECDGNKIFVHDGENNLILAYEGDDAVSEFQHFVEYGRIYNANH